MQYTETQTTIHCLCAQTSGVIQNITDNWMYQKTTVDGMKCGNRIWNVNRRVMFYCQGKNWTDLGNRHQNFKKKRLKRRNSCHCIHNNSGNYIKMLKFSHQLWGKPNIIKSKHHQMSTLAKEDINHKGTHMGLKTTSV